MKSGKCPKCNSTEVFKSKGTLGGSQHSTSLMCGNGDVFELESYLCLNCRNIEMFALETSSVLWGKGKSLTEVVTKSDKWEQVGAK